MRTANPSSTLARNPADTERAYFDELASIPRFDATRENELARSVVVTRHAYWSVLLHRARLREVLATIVALAKDASVIATATGMQKALRTAPTKVEDLVALLVRVGDEHVVADALVELAARSDAPWHRELLRMRSAFLAARNRFVGANLRLVIGFAKRYGRNCGAFADRIQEGNLGLMKAVDRFDPERGVRFSTYAAWWLRHAIVRSVADGARVVRVPVLLQRTFFNAERARRSLRAELGRDRLDTLARDLSFHDILRLRALIMGSCRDSACESVASWRFLSVRGEPLLDGLGAVRFAGSGSAPIPAELITWQRRLGLELLEGYGMSENSSYSHMTRPGGVRVGYVGPPQPGVSHRISAGGEILVKSPGNMLGYYKAPELTAEALDVDGYVHTGDLGSIDEHDRLKITGRMKELFKTSKGKYVAPAPIENELLRSETLDMVVVTGGDKPQPFALAVLAEHLRQLGSDSGRRQAIETALLEHLDRVNTRLDQHERLEKLIVVSEPWTIENGLLTPSLKVRRAALEARYAPNVEAWYANRERVQWFDG